MATKPKAILSTHDGREASPITKATNVLFENGQTAQDILNDRQDAMISPVIENSSSMFKVGQGDNVDYSANVVNGAYEGMVLKGKSMVNCIQEPSSQDVVLPYEFEEGRCVTINDTKESGALGVELKGQTLVNLGTNCPLTSQVGGSSKWINGKLRINFANYTWSGGGLSCSSMIKPSTKYFVYVSFTNNCKFNIQPGHFKAWGAGVETVGHNQTYYRKQIITTKSEITTDTVLYWLLASENPANYDGDKYVDVEFMFIEYQEGMENWDIPYFEGITSCKMPILKSVESLFDAQKIIPNDVFTYSHSTNIGRFEFTNRGDVIASTDIQLPAGTYDISFLIRGACDNGRVAITFAKDGQAWHGCSRVEIYYDEFSSTTFKEIKAQRTFDAPVVITFVGHGWAGGATGSGWCEFKDIRLTPVGKTSILSLPEEVVLRGIDDIKDTLDLATGELIQRIDKVVLDGGEDKDLKKGHWDKENTVTFYLNFDETATQSGRLKFLCNELKFNNHFYDVDEECILCTANVDGTVALYIRLLRSRLENVSVEGLKSYLSKTPIVVFRQRIKPVIKTVDLEVVDQKGNAIPTLKSWNTTTHIYSEIPENSLYPILSHSNPTYPVILKPSTKYSIVANSYSNNHTNSAINFNLGGATVSTTVGNRVTTITTPSTLTNEELVMSGRGNKLNNVMVIEGDVAGDLPYFEGVCDCKSPILSNVGKNLFDINNNNRILSGAVVNFQPLKFEGNQVSVTSKYTCSLQYLIKLKPNTQYSITVSERNEHNKGSELRIARYSPTESSFISDWGNLFAHIHLNNNNKQSSFVTDATGYIVAVLNPKSGNEFLTSTFYDIQLEEGSSATPYEPYKSNILSCNGDKIELTEDMFEQGTTAQYSANIGKTYQWMKENSTQDYNTRRLRTKSLIKIEPNTKLILQNTDNFMYAIGGYGVDKLSLGTFDTGWVQNTTITIPQDVYYISFVIRKKDDTSIAIDDFKNTNFTLSEVDKAIVLRSLPNGVCDTLNVETGEYVQRIGEVVLDGSWGVPSQEVNGYFISYYGLDDVKKENGGNVYCDKFASHGQIWAGGREGVSTFSNSTIWLSISSSKLETPDINGMKKWLSQNPTTVQYELATPIVSTIDVQGFPHAYTNGHVQLSSGSIEQSLTPKVEYSVATNRNGQIRSNQKMVERHQKQLDQLQAIILANLVNSQYNQTLTTLKYELSRV